MPAGLTLNSDGTWSGSAQDTGTYSFTVEIFDAGTGITSTREIVMDVTIGLLAFTGAETIDLGIAGAAMVITGAGIMVIRRRREDGDR